MYPNATHATQRENASSAAKTLMWLKANANVFVMTRTVWNVKMMASATSAQMICLWRRISLANVSQQAQTVVILRHQLRIWNAPINSSPPSAAYMCQWTGSALVQIMACRLFARWMYYTAHMMVLSAACERENCVKCNNKGECAKCTKGYMKDKKGGCTPECKVPKCDLCDLQGNCEKCQDNSIKELGACKRKFCHDIFQQFVIIDDQYHQ